MDRKDVGSAEALPSLLLDLLSPAREVAQSRLDALGGEEWDRVLSMARQHRLEPLLHWRLTHERTGLAVPDTIAQRLEQRFRRATLRALSWQRELLQVHRALEAQGIPCMALKGAFLAQHAYPHPALRPLRDLDILVPPDLVLRAFEVLQASGIQRFAHYAGDPAAVLDADHKHLPPLRSPTGQVSIELHYALFHEFMGFEVTTELSARRGFWDASVALDLAGVPVRYESPTDLLLHMIVHAVYDHQFNNGPLLLSDVAFLLARHPIHWALFWDLAERGRHAMGALLTLRLVERYWGKQPIAWPPTLSDSHDVPLDQAAALILRDLDARSEVQLRAIVDQQSSLRGKLGVLAQKVFPSRQQMATEFPVSPDSLAIVLCYPRRWWRLMTERLPAIVRSLGRAELRNEVETLRQLNRWLAEGR